MLKKIEYTLLDIAFANKQIMKICNDRKKAQKKYGEPNAKKLRQRLDDLDAALYLSEFRDLPGRCHELKGDKSGILSLDLHRQMRLLFEPGENPIPKKDDGGLDWTKVESVIIISIEDTHE